MNRILVIFSFLFLACSSSAEKMEGEEMAVSIYAQEELVEEDFEIIEEEGENLSAYQVAAKAHLAKAKLPYQVFFKENKELYRIESLNFEKIIKTHKNYFLLGYKSYATAIEWDYYFTFDYNGKQLSSANVNAIATDLDGEIVFTTDSTFQVNSVKKQIEWDEADMIEVGESIKDTAYYSITNKGEILTQYTVNDTTAKNNGSVWALSKVKIIVSGYVTAATGVGKKYPFSESKEKSESATKNRGAMQHVKGEKMHSDEYREKKLDDYEVIKMIGSCAYNGGKRASKNIIKDVETL